MEIVKVAIFILLFFLAYSCRKVDILPDKIEVKSDTAKPEDPNKKCKCGSTVIEIPELPTISPPTR